MSDDPGGLSARPGFLLDEHVTPALGDAIRRSVPGLRLHVVGRGDAPHRGAPDPTLLVWIEQHNCFLVTNDRATLPTHLANHVAAGRHVPGVLVLPTRFLSWGQVLDDLTLVCLAAVPDELMDRLVYLPL